MTITDIGKSVEGMRKAGIAITGMGIIAWKTMDFKIACLVFGIAIVGIFAQWSLSMYRARINKPLRKGTE